MSNNIESWNCVASRLVKSELQKRGIRYIELSAMLNHIGVAQSPANLRSKLSKGVFSASLLLQIFHVISADINPSELGVILRGCDKCK